MRAPTATKRPDLGEVRVRAVTLIAQGKVDEAIDLLMEFLADSLNRERMLELDRARLLRKHMGQTSERVDEKQLALLLDVLADRPAPPPETPIEPPDTELPPPRRTPRKGHGRSALPSHLEREEIEHRIADTDRPCPHCGGERECIGYETSEVLERVPATFLVQVHKREKLACRRCEECVATAPAPEKIIDKGRPGPGLLADVMVGKYVDHLPLNRQRSIYLRDGVDIAVSTMTDWVAAVAASLSPLMTRLELRVLGAHVVQADDTGIKVLDRDAPGGAIRGHLWGYVGDATDVVFRFARDWSKSEPQSFLDGRRGWIVADAYKGYDGLFKRPGATAVEVGCWAHARRPFAELALNGDARAAPIIEKIKKLYELEREATIEGVDPDERLQRRRNRSAPIVHAIIGACQDLRGRYPPQDPIAKAAGYVVNQALALTRFLEDGRLPIDNTLIERRIRPIAMGRRNYLFCGSDVGAQRAAVMYSLLGCCALAGVEPRAWLTWALTQLETRRFPMSRIDELLPSSWAASCPASARVASSR